MFYFFYGGFIPTSTIACFHRSAFAACSKAYCRSALPNLQMYCPIKNRAAVSAGSLYVFKITLPLASF